MFDWLKVTVNGKNKSKPVKAKSDNNVIKIDSRRYPIINLNARGFVAGDFDTTVAAGQNASITVEVNDRWGKFSFATRCSITTTDASRGQFAGAFSVLAPDIEHVLIQYAKNKGTAAKTG